MRSLPILLVLVVTAFASAGVASAQQPAPLNAADGVPAIDPREWRSEVDGPVTQVLTIGSAHLGQMDPVPTAAMLEPLIERLVAFAPDIVTHEGISGEQCETLAATPTLYDNAADSYCWDMGAIQQETGLSVSAARIAIAATIADWSANPSAPHTAEQRRRLASQFLSANDRASALVQWLQLVPDDRRTGDGIGQAQLDLLIATQARMNETYSVAAVVAARLGHVRVYAVDDHTSDAVLAVAPANCSEAINRMWASPAAAELRATEAPMVAALTNGEAMLDYYRYINRPETLRGYIDIDHRAAVGSGGAGECGRRYVAWWETRNLRMVGNIRAAIGTRPGSRVLNIVGASHKPYYDLYLAMMADARIVDAETVLR